MDKYKKKRQRRQKKRQYESPAEKEGKRSTSIGELRGDMRNVHLDRLHKLPSEGA